MKTISPLMLTCSGGIILLMYFVLCPDSGCDGTGIHWKENFESTFTEICEIGR